MIVISAGMQKAGTGWYFNMTNDLLVAAGHRDAREVRDQYNLHSILVKKNVALSRLDRSTLKKLERVSQQEGRMFAVKTHRGPSASLRRLMEQGSFAATYIYRDVRDVIVSALERGKVMREKGLDRRYFGIGPYRSFGRLYTVEGATLWGRWQLIPRWRAWTKCNGVLVTRYEDLLANTFAEAKRLSEFLKLNLDEDSVWKVCEKYDRNNAAQGGRLHFNQGIIGRHHDQLSPRHQELCQRRLGPFLKQMGYLD